MTQCERLKEYLKVNGSINPLEAWNEIGVYRLSARINDLRKEMKIDTCTVEVKNKFGEICRVAEYRVVRK